MKSIACPDYNQHRAVHQYSNCRFAGSYGWVWQIVWQGSNIEPVPQQPVFRAERCYPHRQVPNSVEIDTLDQVAMLQSSDLPTAIKRRDVCPTHAVGHISCDSCLEDCRSVPVHGPSCGVPDERNSSWAGGRCPVWLNCREDSSISAGPTKTRHEPWDAVASGSW